MCRKWIYLIYFALVLGLVGTNSAFGLTVNIRIANGSDDAEEHVANGSIELTSSDLELAYEDAGTPATDEQVVGLRFVSVALPKGALVTGAYVEFEVDETKGGTAPVNLIIEGDLTAAPFTSAAKNITSRTSLTTAKVKWSVPNWPAVDVKWQTPDISSIIQEIVNQPGWASGNALVLLFRDDKSNPSTGIRCAEAYEGEATNAPLLHIEAVVKVASGPNPANGATGVEMTPTLSWTPGATAATHDVYFGISSPPSFIANQAATSYAPGPLALGTTCYWQIDEVEADGTTKHTGNIWSFTITNHLVVDDFESYSAVPAAPNPAGLLVHWALDEVGPQIIDSSGNNNMGFLMGATRASPGYDGTGGCLQCLGTGDYAVGLSAAFFNGLDAMTTSMWVKSNAINTDAGFFHGEDPVGNDNRGMRYDADGSTGGGKNVIKIGVTSTGGTQQLESSSGVQTTEWQHLLMTWRSGKQLALYVNGVLNTPTANSAARSGTLTGYTKLVVGKGAKDDLASESWNGLIDELRVYNYALAPGEVITLAGFVPTKVLSDTWSASGSVTASLEFDAAHGGKQAMRVNYDNTILPYQGQVSCTPPFTDLTTGGAKALLLWFYGTPGNIPEGMDVAVEDAVGVVGVVNHAYPEALTINEWSKWEIPFSALADVNLAAVKKLSIGVGNRATPTPGGAGVIRIDDIQVSKPRIILELADVTAPGDTVQGIPSGLPCGTSPTANYSPCNELPPLAIDDNISTKYLNFGGNFDPGEGPSGFRVAPSVRQTIVTGLTFTTANDAAERDPVAFELYGSNVSIAGPYTLIASGEIVDFKGATAWPRFTKNATPISFANNVAYDYYQVLFTAIRGPSANSMQIAEVELIGVSAP